MAADWSSEAVFGWGARFTHRSLARSVRWARGRLPRRGDTDARRATARYAGGRGRRARPGGARHRRRRSPIGAGRLRTDALRVPATATANAAYRTRPVD